MASRTDDHPASDEPQGEDTPVPLGDAALALRWANHRPAPLDLPPGVIDAFVAFQRLAVYFDPIAVACDQGEPAIAAVARWLRESTPTTGDTTPTDERLIQAPVIYDGDDLQAVADAAGLSPCEAARRHRDAVYRVAAIGFQPGFAYLEGLPAELHTPRRATPRTRVPAGAVAIGGPYTGVYPHDAPGGWNLIGRSPLRAYDPNRDPPALWRVGDRVEFVEVDQAEFDRLARDAAMRSTATDPGPAGRPVLRVVSAGAASTLQAPPRYGAQQFGVGPGGAMDTRSLRIANALAGAPADAPAIEAALVGPVLECLEATTIGVAGATPADLHGARRLRLSKGQSVDLRRLTGGARCYVAIEGGFSDPAGRVVNDGATLHAETASSKDGPAIGAWSLPRPAPTSTLRVLRGPDFDLLDADSQRTLFERPMRIDPRSNRMGVRLTGAGWRLRDAPPAGSQPVCFGAVQLPPDGEPILLAADRQTLGGYPIVAVVASVDWPAIGQLRPGNVVRFVEVDLLEATRLLREAERALALSIAGIKLKP